MLVRGAHKGSPFYLPVCNIRKVLQPKATLSAISGNVQGNCSNCKSSSDSRIMAYKFGIFHHNISPRLGFLSRSLISNRLFSTKKHSHLKALEKKTGENIVLEGKNREHVDLSIDVAGRSKKKLNPLASCSGVNGTSHGAVTRPMTKACVKNSKLNTTSTEGNHIELNVAPDTKKDAVTKTHSQAKIDEFLLTRNQKTRMRKMGEKCSVLSTSSAATVATNSHNSLGVKKAASSITCLPVLSNSKPLNGAAKSGNGQFKPLFPPSGKSVMVVESVTKANVIQKYLGDMYEVLASHGHVRNLSARSRSVRPDEDFSMVWEVPVSAWTHLKSVKVALSGAQNLILASDPDREGEAIAWHIIEMLEQQDALNDSITVARVVFHEITESSIKSALQSPRMIDANLVNAHLARRALDYLIGCSISPLLWRKLPGCQSAGRVQSSALALLCDRETEIEQFRSAEYWTVDVKFLKKRLCSLKSGASFSSCLSHFNSKKLDQLSICCQKEAKEIRTQLSGSNFKVTHIKSNKQQKNPPVPYITSSLQQDSSSKLHFSPAYTMKLAQKLYEGIKLSDAETTGLITYIRTDGLHVSDAAGKKIHSLVSERYGKKYAAKTLHKYFSKVKNSQEAHEAIRPTNIMRFPSSLVGILDDDSLKLYSLIWTRTVACQMKPSISETLHVDISNIGGDVILRSSASKVVFAGYQIAYQDKDAKINGIYDDASDKGSDTFFEVLKKLKVNDILLPVDIELGQHFTKPAARYSEASLIKKLEDLGIGRPSTYVYILKVLQDRDYAIVKGRVMHPEFRGRMVSMFLSQYFPDVSDYAFTADMENELDKISAGMTEWKGYLTDYWSHFSKYLDNANNTSIHKVEKMLEERFGHILFDSLPGKGKDCPSCSKGTLKFKVSRFGAGYFIGCDQHPKCKYIAKTIFSEEDDSVSADNTPFKACPPKLLGHRPDSNEKVLLKKGPYGYYVQLGDDRRGHIPKRVSVENKDMDFHKDMDSVTLEDALDLLQYPLTLGKHPEDKWPVLLKISRHGFSVRHRRTISPVPKNLNGKDITLEAALKLLKGKNAKTIGRVKGQSLLKPIIND